MKHVMLRQNQFSNPANSDLGSSPLTGDGHSPDNTDFGLVEWRTLCEGFDDESVLTPNFP